MNKLLNKISISPEAKIDYETMFNIELPIYTVKLDIENSLKSIKTHLLNNSFSNFRCMWYDKSQDAELILFFEKGYRFRCMQVWNLVGMCGIDDIDDLDDSCDLINQWLNTKLEI